jgi:hypothetical protein
MAGWGAAIQAAISLYGDHQVQNKIGNAGRKLRGSVKFDPKNITDSPFGRFVFDNQGNPFDIQEDSGAAQNRQVQNAMNPYLLSGGMFNNADLQSALENNDIAGTFQGAQQGFQQQMGNSMFGNMGAMQQGLFGQGSNALMQAGNQQGLINQNLQASRAAAQPFEDRLMNRTQNQLFSQGRLGSSGGSQQYGDMIGSIMGADTQRILNSQQMGLANRNQMQQFGMGALQQAQGIEGQQFGQNLGALQQNQSAGQQRLQNAQGLFGLGRDTMGQQMGLGFQGQQGQLNQNQFMQQMILGLMNSENNRIGAMGMTNQALAGLYGGGAAESGGMMGGLASSIGGMDFGG